MGGSSRKRNNVWIGRGQCSAITMSCAASPPEPHSPTPLGCAAGTKHNELCKAILAQLKEDEPGREWSDPTEGSSEDDSSDE